MPGLKILKLVFNKYLLAAVGFVAWIAFFDQNDWYSQREREQELQDVKTNIASITNEIETMEGNYSQLQKDPAVLEKYAREHYRMKKSNEDLYVIEKEN